jgi:hypothetical protein
MPRAGHAQQAERLNLARSLLRQQAFSEAVQQLAQQCAISRRQSYRYVSQALRLKRPLAIPDSKVAFTVKLSRSLVSRLRQRATQTGLTLSALVARAILANLERRSGRG